jgi:uncharacterized protein YcfJ|tara:strand:- start:197 stop:775 length:579 start_codon:yes stop_codon:yes gene_type:complete
MANIKMNITCWIQGVRIMNNIIKTSIVSVIFMLISLAAASAETIRGTVTALHPVYTDHVYKTPYQNCYTEQVFIPDNRLSSATPEIAGGIVGGVIGNQFGRGSGKTIATVAGVLLGSSIAHDMDQPVHGHTKSIQRCETRYSEHVQSRIRGYNIGVTIPNGRIISMYKETPYTPPPLHSQVNVSVTYKIGNY